MKKIALIFVLTAILLSSCFIPDNYDLTITVKKNASYTFNYDGELNYAPVMEAFIEGKVDDDIKVDLKEVIDGMKDNKDFKKVKDLGQGKIKVEYEVEKDAGVDFNFMDKDMKFYSIEYNDDNEMIITGFKVEDEAIATIDKFNTKLEGKLTVILPKKMTVKSQNADKKEKLNKKTVAYIWNLDINSEKPEMLIKF